MIGLNKHYLHIITVAVGIAFLLAVLLSIPALAGEKGGGSPSKDNEPIRVSSDLMESESGTGLVIFKGNVVVTRGELTIKSDELRIVNYQSSGAMEKMIATGNVRLQDKNRAAYAEKAIYYNKEEKVELLGNPRVEDGDNIITGEVMVLFLKDEKSIVKGSKDVRVNVVFHPQEK